MPRLAEFVCAASTHPVFGDPTALGWVTTFGYFLAAGLCFRVWMVRRRAADHGTLFWLALALFMLLLGVNKQLDLQTLLTEVGRGLARRQGWYEGRRAVQEGFIAGVAAAGCAAVVLFVLLARRGLAADGLAVIGAAVLIGFIVIRAASFHHVDHILSLPVGGVKLHRVIELVGIGCVVAAGLVQGRTTARAGTQGERNHPESPPQ